ncbi:MAG: hypothetical protein ABSD63_13970 [Candidatus Korobacteraceae bacterium]|jgi:hypothetical protein
MSRPFKSFFDFWTSDVKDHRRGLAITTALAVLGYAGAAYFYAGLVGFNPVLNLHQLFFVCPVCPCITSFGDPTDKFIGRTFGLGTMNAIAFISIGWLLIATYKGVRLLKSKMSQVLSPTHP